MKSFGNVLTAMVTPMDKNLAVDHPNKTALRLIGLGVGGLRQSLISTTKAEEDALAAVLEDVELL